ncbi:homing endonuclease [Pectobacterium phage DU_PP_I]|nr:homing endonuclease [Pectobacterium phage DU_PP_I]ATS93933.1 homing endonuclease [Pectobacterium phage DU_PP_IV]
MGIPAEITAEDVSLFLEYFRYDPLTGYLYWKKGKQRVKEGQLAQTPDSGYLTTVLNGRHHRTHRIIWCLHNGPLAAGVVIDHKDRNKVNNLLDNLRVATRGENMQNTKLRSDNSLGHKGIHQRENGRFRVAVSASGKRTSVGTFGTLEEAIVERDKAYLRIQGEFRRVE